MNFPDCFAITSQLLKSLFLKKKKNTNSIVKKCPLVSTEELFLKLLNYCTEQATQKSFSVPTFNNLLIY